MTRLVEILKRWWPVPAFIAGSVIAQILLWPDPTPVGHAAGHYSNATVLFAIAPAVGITIWASAAGLRRHPAFWLLNASIVASIAVVYAANMQIVHAIGAERWTNDQASTLGPTRPGFEASHLLTERAEWASAAIVIALAVCLARWHALKASVTATAIVASIILPPWMFPARGIVIIAIGSLHQRAKQLPPHRFDATVPAHISARAELP
jgi:hypothetical protein